MVTVPRTSGQRTINDTVRAANLVTDELVQHDVENAPETFGTLKTGKMKLGPMNIHILYGIWRKVIMRCILMLFKHIHTENAQRVCKALP